MVTEIVTSENKEEYIKDKLNKLKPSPRNEFYSNYKDKLEYHPEYHDFVKNNWPHINEHTTKIKDQINKYGITDKEKQKRINSQMEDSVMHVKQAWNSMKASKEFIEKNKG
jgi:hypothetical protein